MPRWNGDEFSDSAGSGRYVRMERVGRAETLGFAELRTGLGSVAMGNMTVQSAVIYPKELVVYGSTRSRPASDGPFWKLDLSAYLEAQPH